MSNERAQNPTQDDLRLFLLKHPDFRGVSERGLCVLIYRQGTVSVPVHGLTDGEKLEILGPSTTKNPRKWPVTSEERADARRVGLTFPRLARDASSSKVPTRKRRSGLGGRHLPES